MSASDSKTINFEISTSSSSISIELDDDYHIILYGEERSEFDKTELAYLKVMPTYDVNPYDILASAGVCTKASQNNIADVTEELTFENEKEAELANTPFGAVTSEWIAGDDVSILMDGKKITTTSNTIGILQCEYQVEFDRLQLTVEQDMEDDSVIVMVGSGEDYASETVDYSGTAESVSLEILVTDICTGDPIPDATVVIDGLPSGITNENGIFTVVTPVQTGDSFDIKTTATGYTDSDADFLNNDSFIVPD